MYRKKSCLLIMKFSLCIYSITYKTIRKYLTFDEYHYVHVPKYLIIDKSEF